MSQRSVSERRSPVVTGLLLGLLAVGSLSACGSSTTGGTSSVKTDPLTFDNSTIPVAYVGEEFKANLLVTGGVGPYAYRVASGSLPPGLTYSGGLLAGTPTQAGAYKFTVEASDANLGNKVATYTLNVNELPPLSLEPTLPPGEIRGETRIPVTVRAPRAVRAARFTWDLGKDMQVTKVQAADTASPVFWRQEGSVLSVDLGFKTVPRTGARVALVTVRPLKPATLSTANFWYESRDAKGKVLGEKQRPAPPAATPPATVTPGAAAPGTATPGSAATTPATATPAAPSGQPSPAPQGTTGTGTGTPAPGVPVPGVPVPGAADTATPPPSVNPPQTPPEEKKP